MCSCEGTSTAEESSNIIVFVFSCTPKCGLAMYPVVYSAAVTSSIAFSVFSLVGF